MELDNRDNLALLLKMQVCHHLYMVTVFIIVPFMVILIVNLLITV